MEETEDNKYGSNSSSSSSSSKDENHEENMNNNNNNNIIVGDEDRAALESICTLPNSCKKKIQSYSQQLLPPSPHKRHPQVRKYSLDNLPPPPSSSSSSSSSSTTTTTPLLFSNDPLPDFVASGGSNPIFKTPARAAVHPGRPTCLELRPHPLRETQLHNFLRNIACTDTQLWAGQQSGVRFWSFDNIYDSGSGSGGTVRRGDEDAAPFHESVDTTPTMCLLIDGANALVWTGHKNGKIRSWRIHQHQIEDGPFKEVNSWQAHKGPVLSMVMSSYGDLWSGGEGGVIKIWPWETIEKSFSIAPTEKHLVTFLMHRAEIDLRSQVTVNGVCSISSSDVKCLLSDNIKATIWCAQPASFSLWDARSKKLLKVFNIDGQIENRFDVPASQQPDQQVEDDMKVKFVPTSKKEKSQGFLQRSRNAILGAADAVRRVAYKGTGAFSEDTKRTGALVLTADGMIWTGCTNGLLVQWDGDGNRLQEFTHHSSPVQCLCTFGTRIYVGYVSGIIQVLDLEGNLVAVWVAHSNPVLKMAVGNGSIYSLAAHGGIRGWNITSPGPLDNIIRSELTGREVEYTRKDKFRILIGTWNVGQGRASHDALMVWLGSVAADVGIVVVGLQEVEMGAGFLAMSAAKETVGLEGSAVGQWWQDAMGKALEEGMAFERMGSRQLAGLLISLWVRKKLRTYVGDIDAGAVPCGFGRAIGNKGGVGLRIRVHDRIMCFINCHLAAHLEAVKKRNADFDHIYKNMTFAPSASNITASGMVGFLISCCSLALSLYLFWLLYISGLPFLLSIAAAVATASHSLKSAAGLTSEDKKPDLAEADMVVFFGDFNYRLFGISYDEARDLVSQRSFDWLREKDQLRKEMMEGRVFQGMREAIVRFPPTYKFEKNKPGLGGYDSGEKKRIPAWCDRIIYRDTRSESATDCSLRCPVVSSVLLYEACMDVTESDHKPVRCKFHVEVSHVDRSVRRQEYGKIIKCNEQVKSILDEFRYIPETSVSTNSIALHNQDTCILRITNKCLKEKAIFRIICEGQSVVKDDEEADYHPRGAFGFPRWLEVTPAVGIIKADNYADISVHHEEFHTLEEFVDGIPQNWWSEDTRDKQVVLRVLVQGSTSTDTNIHRIHVRHCFSAKTVRVNAESSSSHENQEGLV